jgi:hypothetical protein
LGRYLVHPGDQVFTEPRGQFRQGVFQPGQLAQVGVVGEYPLQGVSEAGGTGVERRFVPPTAFRFNRIRYMYRKAMYARGADAL